MAHDPFGASETISTPLGEREIFRLDALSSFGDLDAMPYSIKVLLESVLRNHDGRTVRDEDVQALAGYDASKVEDVPPASCSRTSRVCPPSSTWRRCVLPSSA